MIDKYPDKYPDFLTKTYSIAFKRTLNFKGVLISLVFTLFAKKIKMLKTPISINIYRELSFFCVPKAQIYVTSWLSNELSGTYLFFRSQPINPPTSDKEQKTFKKLLLSLYHYGEERK